MRIVLDLQGAQASNKARGIGRYTTALAQAIARQAGSHEVLVALNGALQDSIEPLRADFTTFIPDENIRVWRGLHAVSGHDAANAWRRQASERLREAFLSSLEPDVVHVGSLFEGFGDDAVTGVGTFNNTLATSVTLYDVIPLLRREVYLRLPAAESWYENKLDHLRRAHLWLAISEASRRDAIRCLGLPEEAVVTIAGAADERFRPLRIAPAEAAALRVRFGLHRPFVMYTGGIDHRKNIEGLIRAYALLPDSVRRGHQLAIVCTVQPVDAHRLKEAAVHAGLGAGEIVITGFVSDADLVALYNLCALFVFPSLYEGFGLPLLEAMSCGAPAISADNSSLPEIIGDRDALFDSSSDAAIAAAMHRSLTDMAYRQHLKWNASVRAKAFSWDASAKRAIDAFEDLRSRRQRKVRCVRSPRRPRLAYVAPLPPERSGIADYGVELLVGLTRHYEIDVIVDQPEVSAPRVLASCGVRSVEQFEADAHRYHRVLYEFGNSHFHQHMFGLLERHPGVVSLHDFFLSGALLHMERVGVEPHCWSRALYASHGYHALKQRFIDPPGAVISYPASRPVLENALGVITNSSFARLLAQQWYGPEAARTWEVIPQVRCLEAEPDRARARKQLGVGERDFLVCSFGIVAPTKLNHRLLDAWRSSLLGADEGCRLVFVGDHYGSEYGQGLLRSIRACPLPQNIRITGFTPPAEYRLWLAAADAAVQLRTQSRGETSRGTLDCLSFGVPTIANAHGSMPELPVSRVLPDLFADDALAAALEELRNDSAQRAEQGRRARQAIAERHNPRRVAEQVSSAIEKFYGCAEVGRRGLMASVVGLIDTGTGEEDWLHLGEAIAQTLPGTGHARQVLVDVTGLITGLQRPAGGGICEPLGRLLAEPRPDIRIEPVRHDGRSALCYARRFALAALDLPPDMLDDEAVEARAGDVYLDLFPLAASSQGHDALLTQLTSLGVRTYAFLDALPVPEGEAASRERLLTHYHGVVCTTGETMRWMLQHAAHVSRSHGREVMMARIDTEVQVGSSNAEPPAPLEWCRPLLELVCNPRHDCWTRPSASASRARLDTDAEVRTRERQWMAQP